MKPKFAEEILPHVPHVADARKRLGWTQQRLADTLRVDIRQVRRWERGETPVPYVTTLALRFLLAGE